MNGDVRSALKQKGQSLVLGLVLALVASVTLFLVFNSGRAVNEKINLVNAADAAAYSGAQIAARQLNFMAYTNRAMIANEVSIGHVFSYQMEMDILGNTLESAFTSVPNNPLIQILIQIIDFFVQGDFSAVVNNSFETIGEAVSILTDVTDGISGVYALSVDANNAFYSTLQQQAFQDFAYPTEGRPLVETAMQAVVRDYEMRPNAPIVLNDPEVLQNFANSDDVNEDVRQSAMNALSMQRAFCQMVLFAKPGALVGETPGEVGAVNDMQAFCESIATGGSGNSGMGSPDAPVDDQGSMLEMLRTTVSNFSNTEWIRERNANYAFIPGLIYGKREGSTEVVYENGQLNWTAPADSLQVSTRLLFITIPLFTANASGDAVTMSNEAGDIFNDGLLAILENYGMCGDDSEINCDTLANSNYKGIQRYTYLNPSYANPRVTAFLSQQRCSDNIGVDEEGVQLEGWKDNMPFLEKNRKVCDGEVFAVSQAEVFFQRPPCEDESANGGCAYGFSGSGYDDRDFMEKPNLFNPFWQVRLIPPAQG